MKTRLKNTLRALAKHFGLKIVFVHYFDDRTHGKLLVEEKRILINARQPRNEYIFTVLHEIGHFVVHVQRILRSRHPRFCNINWKIERLDRLCFELRRYFRYIFSKESGKEWEADLWAMCAFEYLAKHIDCRDELRLFCKRHPDKKNLYRLVRATVIYCDIKTRIKKVINPIILAFKAI